MSGPFLICRIGRGAAPVVVGRKDGYGTARMAEQALFELALEHERRASEQGDAAGSPAWLEEHKIITRNELERRQAGRLRAARA